MKFADSYLTKSQLFIQHIQEPPSGLLQFIVVIPAYLEDKILATLDSIENAAEPECITEILIVVNYSESDSEENKQINLKIYNELVEWCSNHSSSHRSYYPILAHDLPKKHAGVGMARKIGMDEALYRFNAIENPQGLILSLDADVILDHNYFLAIENKMADKERFRGFIPYFEHTANGSEFSSWVYDAIMQYELHLRYYKHILKYIGFPYSNYTIGSCFGVRAEFYSQQGGMNRRQAGEDFYFLNKLFPHGEFAEITETCVHPSPRPSLRVPFGTGASVTKIITKNKHVYKTYSPSAFYDLKQVFCSIESLYACESGKLNKIFKNWPFTIQEFLNENIFIQKLEEIRSNCGSSESFYKRFYYWFDGFKVVKYLNFTHEKYYSKVPVVKAVRDFLKSIGYNGNEIQAYDYLELFRQLDLQQKTIY